MRNGTAGCGKTDAVSRDGERGGGGGSVKKGMILIFFFGDKKGREIRTVCTGAARKEKHLPTP